MMKADTLRLQTEIERRQMTIAEFAKAAGFKSAEPLSRAINKGWISYGAARRISQYLKCSIFDVAMGQF